MIKWEKLALLVEQSGGYHEVRVLELLTWAGKQTAGSRIVQNIEEELAAQHIGHFPTRIPRNQNARVLLYNQNQQGPGGLLHLVRQLTETGTSTDLQIVTLWALLRQIQRTPREGAASA